MTVFVIKQTASYEVEAATPAEALTAFLDIEGDSTLLPCDVERRVVLDCDGVEVLADQQGN